MAGVKLKNGIVVSETSYHFADRFYDRELSIKSVKGAAFEPLAILPVKRQDGAPSQYFIGKINTIVINPDTGRLVTGMKTRRKVLKKYGEKYT